MDKEAGAEVSGGFIHLRVIEGSDAWILELQSFSGPAFGDSRLRSLIERLTDTDALLRRVLLRGKVTKLVVPFRATGTTVGKVEDLLRPLLLPASFESSLYEYQNSGVRWLLEHPRAILADDMGLGKTAQAVTAVRHLNRSADAGWTLVVAPGTLVSNWLSEFTRWAPELVVDILLPVADSRAAAWSRSSRVAHVSITSYDQLRAAAPAALASRPSVLIADEAHRLRNDDSQVSQAFRSIAAERLWLLTGTPVENSAEDIAVLLSLLEPQRFAAEDASLHRSSLRAQIRPYLLRRTKDDVLPDLPPVIEYDEFVDLSDAQAAAYNRAIRHVRRDSDSDWLAIFNKLRSICDLDPTTGASSKLDRAEEIAADAKATGEKLVVFSYLLDPLTALSQRLSAASISHCLITGRQSQAQRAEAIAEFKADPSRVALLASMRVASEGLTLTEASNVVFLNRWWNPSANQQARDRVVRIGQSRTVRVVTLTTRNTIEERIPKILEAKSLTFDALVNSLAHRADLFEELS